MNHNEMAAIEQSQLMTTRLVALPGNAAASAVDETTFKKEQPKGPTTAAAAYVAAKAEAGSKLQKKQSGDAAALKATETPAAAAAAAAAGENVEIGDILATKGKSPVKTAAEKQADLVSRLMAISDVTESPGQKEEVLGGGGGGGGGGRQLNKRRNTNRSPRNAVLVPRQADGTLVGWHPDKARTFLGGSATAAAAATAAPHANQCSTSSPSSLKFNGKFANGGKSGDVKRKQQQQKSDVTCGGTVRFQGRQLRSEEPEEEFVHHVTSSAYMEEYTRLYASTGVKMRRRNERMTGSSGCLLSVVLCSAISIICLLLF